MNYPCWTRLLVALGALMAVAGAAEPVPGILEASGSGTVDMTKVKNKIQARMMATRAAKVDAQRNLLEVVEGVRVTAGTTVKDAQLESDIIANRVKGMLKGAFVLNESVEEMEDSYYAEVQLGVCLTSEDPRCQLQPTLSQIVYPDLEKSAEARKYQPPTPAATPTAPASGLIVDLGGTGASRILDMRITTSDGKEVYGPGHFDASHGGDWLHFAQSVDGARAMSGIVGEAPLVVTAQEVRDSGAHVIVSDGNAERIYSANAANGDFLAHGSVILVID